MNKHVIARSLLAFALASWVATALPANASDTRAEIAAFMTQSAHEWNAGNLDAFMRGYEDSPATLYVGSKTVFNGYAAIRAHYASHYGKTMGVLRFSGLEVRSLGPGYAVAVAHWHLAMTDGSHPTGIFSLVLHRGAGGWHIIVDHSP
jgi:ketosteroid isomerase-like protein